LVDRVRVVGAQLVDDEFRLLRIKTWKNVHDAGLRRSRAQSLTA
jgi:hypothetical protein